MPDLLLELADRALRDRPRCVVECGSGASTVVLARCVQMNGEGHVYSLEHSAEFAAATRTLLSAHGLQQWATVLDAPLREHVIGGESWQWYGTDSLRGRAIDLLLVDGPPAETGRLARYPAGPLLFPQLAPGAAVLLDDADRDEEREIARRWRAEFPRLVQQTLALERGCILFSKAAD